MRCSGPRSLQTPATPTTRGRSIRSSPRTRDGTDAIESGGPEIAERFLREELGWESFLFAPFLGSDDDGVVGGHTDLRYLRCAPGKTNTYPNIPDQCARRGSVRTDRRQPVRRGGQHRPHAACPGRQRRRDLGGEKVGDDRAVVRADRPGDRRGTSGDAPGRVPSGSGQRRGRRGYVDGIAWTPEEEEFRSCTPRPVALHTSASRSSGQRPDLARCRHGVRGPAVRRGRGYGGRAVDLRERRGRTRSGTTLGTRPRTASRYP